MRAGLLAALESAVGRLLPGGLQVPDYFPDLDPLDMSLFGGLGAPPSCFIGMMCPVLLSVLLRG